MLDLWISWMIWLIQEVDRILIRLSLMVMGPPGWGIWLCWTPRYIYIHVCTYLRGFCNFQFIIFFLPQFWHFTANKRTYRSFCQVWSAFKTKKTMHTKSSPEYKCMINDSEIYNELLNKNSMKHYSINILFVICINRKKTHFSPYNIFKY